MVPPLSWSAAWMLLTAAALGAALGIGSVTFTGHGQAVLASSSAGFRAVMVPDRARPQHAGDTWPHCGAAWDAGTAPIYIGEPGYHDEMDRDGDGIACEPIH